MSLSIESKKSSSCSKYNFSVYNHTLSMDELDKYVLEIIYDPIKLNHLFQPNVLFDQKDRISQLRRFIETDFKNCEDTITDLIIKNRIKENTVQSYYSFFAEALLARLNIDYVDTNLITGVLSTKDTIKTTATGADVCMFSNDSLVLGEAKFYGNLNGGLASILEDSSFMSKLESYCNIVLDSDSDIILKNINGKISEKTAKEIKELPLVFTGFVLHTKSVRGNYNDHYDKIDSICIDKMPDHYKIHLYHLPINSKDEFIFKAQRKALDLIIDLKSLT